MGVEGVGATGDPVEAEIDAGAAPGLTHPFMDASDALVAAELLPQVFVPVDSAGRDIRVELEGVPMDLRVCQAGRRQGLVQTPLPYEAPGTDHIGEYVYAHQRLILV